MSGLALRVSDAEVIRHVEALIAPTDSVGDRGALRLHLLVLCAERAAVQTLGQVVPQIGVVLLSTRPALCGRGGGAVRHHVFARWTLGTKEDTSGGWVHVFIHGSGFHRGGAAEDRRQQEQRRYEQLRRGPLFY